MGDVMPNYLVEQQRLISSIAAQRAAIERSKLDILELADRKARSLVAIAASERNLVDAGRGYRGRRSRSRYGTTGRGGARR